jgi:hypothetical protein
MPEELHTCPKCQRGNFTAAGLRSHRCGPKPAKGAASHPKLPLQGESKPPDWSRARFLVEGIKHHFRLSLAGQILLGHELQTLKVELNFCGAGRPNKLPHSEGIKSLNRTWDQWCKSELGISDSTADRLIETYEAAKSKIKKLGGNTLVLTLLETSPAKLHQEDRAILASMVDKLEWGESQKQLLEEFRLVKQQVALKGGDTSAAKTPKPAAAQQLAFAFFRPIGDSVGKATKAVENLRLAPDYQRLLYALPLVSSEPGEVSLSSLEAEIEAALNGDLAKALADIRAAKAAKMKTPATSAP